uniref:Uncharacterized protein n=1 Tax=Helianthus annuus TaxID=4232 RepID=A0A251T523_HELAN
MFSRYYEFISINNLSFLPDVGGARFLGLVVTPSFHRIKSAYTTPLTFSGSYKDRGSRGGRGSGTTSCKGSTVRPSLDTNNLIKLFYGLDSLKLELNRLEIEVTDYDREPSESQS